MYQLLPELSCFLIENVPIASTANKICNHAKPMFQVRLNTKRGYSGEKANVAAQPSISNVCEITYGYNFKPKFRSSNIIIEEATTNGLDTMNVIQLVDGLSPAAKYPPLTITAPGSSSLGCGQIPSKQVCKPFTWPSKVHQSAQMTHGNTAIAINDLGLSNDTVNFSKTSLNESQSGPMQEIKTMVTAELQAPHVNNTCMDNAASAKL